MTFKVCLAIILPFLLHDGVQVKGQSFDVSTGALISCFPNPCLNGGTCFTDAQNGTKTCRCLESHVGRYCQHRNPCYTGNQNTKRCLHGGRCEVTFPGGSFVSATVVPKFRCHCQVGYEASLCEISVANVCDRSPCQNGGRCELKTLDTFTCKCRHGYRGETCNTVDYCASSPCKNRAQCTSLENTFKCTCNPGYTGDTCTQDINECAGANPCNNGGTCVNYLGSYKCQCQRGFTGKNCSEIHIPCQPNPCENGGKCNRDPFDSYRSSCECPRGFTGKLCERNIDDCEKNICANGATCNDGIGSYTCECPPAYTGLYCNEDVDECQLSPSQCKNGATCRNFYGGYECMCVNGWEGKHCDVNINDCSPEVCFNGATCVDRVGSYACECPPGKTGLFCHLDDACANNPCSTGLCDTSPVDGSYRCSCPLGLAGPDCQEDLNECQLANPKLCEHDGVCINTIGSFICQCARGYTGSRCETNINECASNPCQNDGTCLDMPGEYKCVCMPGFNGINCEIDVDDCKKSPCMNGGVCRDLVNGYQCTCPLGYSGPTCNISAGDCDINPCRNGGRCIEGKGVQRCKCPEGFEGMQCEKGRMSLCSPSPCRNGICVEKDGEFSCECITGFSGSRCQYEVNPCADQPCMNGGQCWNGMGTYSCKCTPGFVGGNCEIRKYCEGQACLGCYPGACYHGGICSNSTLYGYECTCSEGYIGPRCEAAVDQCISNPCSKEGALSCQQYGNGYRCRCKKGYMGLNCEEKADSCHEGLCFNRGICIDSVSGPICKCIGGYGGTRCESVYKNECQPNPCLNGGRCSSDPGDYSPGDFKCDCAGEYTGERCELLKTAPPLQKDVPRVATDRKYKCPIDDCETLAKNGLCDEKCNNIECDYDGQECSLKMLPWYNCTLRTKAPCWAYFNNNRCDEECNNPQCLFDGMDCMAPVDRCPVAIEDFCRRNYANGVCDEKCNRRECDFDGLDCDQRPPKLADGILIIILKTPPSQFQEQSANFLRSLSQVLRTVVKLKMYENGTDQITPWILNGGIGKVTADDSPGSVGTALTLELDNRQCEGTCFETADSAARFLAGKNQRNELELPFKLYSVSSQGNQEGFQGNDTKQTNLLWLLVIGVFLVVFVVGGVMINRNKKRVRAVTWFPEGFIKSTSTAFLNDHMTLSKSGLDEYKKPAGSGYENHRHSDISTANSYFHESESGLNPPSAKRLRGNDQDPSTRQWTPGHFEETEMRKVDRFASTPPTHDDNGLDINTLGEDGYSALMLTISRGSGLDGDEDMEEVNMVRDFLSQGADTEVQSLSSGETALHLAARFGRTEMARLLMEHGANLAARDNSGRTPLHSAVAADAISIVMLFKSAMGRFKFEFNARDNQGWTPLIEAVKLGTTGTDIVDEILKLDGVDVNQADQMQRTALHHAAAVNNAQACKQLLYRNAKVDIQDENAQTPLFIAAREGNLEAAKELLEFKANSEMANDEDITPDCIAKKNGHKNIVKLLEEHREMVHSPPQSFPNRNLNIFPNYVNNSSPSLSQYCKQNQNRPSTTNRRRTATSKDNMPISHNGSHLEFANLPNFAFMNADGAFADWKPTMDLKSAFPNQPHPGHDNNMKYQHYGLPNHPTNAHFVHNSSPNMRANDGFLITPSPGSPGQYSSSPASDWSDGVRSPRMPASRQMVDNNPGQQFHYITRHPTDGTPMFL